MDNDKEKIQKQSEYNKKYYQENRDKLLEKHREWNRNNKDIERRRKYYEKETKELKNKYDRLNVLIPKEDGKIFRKVLKENNDTITNWTTTRIKKYLKENQDKI